MPRHPRTAEFDPLNHPTPEQLRSWIDGTLSVAIRSQLENHLEQCQACAETLETLEPDVHPMVIRLREMTEDPSSSATYHEPLTTCWAEETHSEPRRLNQSADSPNRWRLLRLLASGGIGEVWIAEDQLLMRKAAIKRLRPETAHLPSVQDRFLREARITAQLTHPCTVSVIDLIEDGADSYYAMTLVEGETLREHVAQFHRKMRHDTDAASSELFTLLRHWVAVARTIAYAHSSGFLHRDIKSENVVVGAYGQVTVIDWGLAKRIEDTEPNESVDLQTDQLYPTATQATRSGLRLGTPPFMSPEQAHGDVEAVDRRTDTYALSGLLYEILTGQPPFVGNDADAVMEAVKSQPPADPRTLKPFLPLRLCQICLQGLAKDKNDRHQSAAVLADEVEDWMDNESIRLQADEIRRKLFELSDDIMLVFDNTPTVLWANSAWERVMGWKPEELIGKVPNVLVHPDDQSRDAEVFASVSRGEVATGMERRMRAKDGSYRWYSWTATPILDEGTTCAIGRDIDDRVRREKEYSAVLDAMPDATIVLNRDQTIFMVNQHATEMFHYSKDELVGQKIDMLLSDRFRRVYKRIGESYMKNATGDPLTARNLIARDKNGDEFEVSLRIRPVEHESNMRYIGSIRRYSPASHVSAERSQSAKRTES
tara:strand:- start:10009 stop:11973 length:1965 start_codon:yes stop_codon:yes gene_type:complete